MAKGYISVKMNPVERATTFILLVLLLYLSSEFVAVGSPPLIRKVGIVGVVAGIVLVLGYVADCILFCLIMATATES